jgi:hypothetical protein
MKLGMIGAALAAALSLGGCVSPLVTPNPLTMQYKVTNAVNWQQIAQRAVLAIPKSDNLQAVYVDAGGVGGAEFGGIYKRFLEEQLYLAGYPVVNTPEGAGIILSYEVAPLHYAPYSEKKLWQYFTPWGAAAGLGVAAASITRAETGVGVGAAATPLLDLAASMNGNTNAEVILTTTISVPNGGNHVNYVATETFYVQPDDLHFYTSSPDHAPPTGAVQTVSLPVAVGYR